jgi:hypothetical protein
MIGINKQFTVCPILKPYVKNEDLQISSKKEFNLILDLLYKNWLENNSLKGIPLLILYQLLQTYKLNNVNLIYGTNQIQCPTPFSNGCELHTLNVNDKSFIVGTSKEPIVKFNYSLWC